VPEIRKDPVNEDAAEAEFSRKNQKYKKGNLRERRNQHV